MRILVADAEVTSRNLLSRISAKLGHQCLAASDGVEAWDLLCSTVPDVLLTDWMMPGVDGAELCRRVRTELSGGYVYVLLITGLGQPEQILEGMAAGADDYLVKPVDPFAVETRLVAAERVTRLHRQLTDMRIQLEQANLKLLDQSRTDPLTGLGNRRRMEEDLDRTHGRAQRIGRRYCVVLFDVDYFKLYNDNYGHPMGDDVLRRVARCIEDETRVGESAYRYGGEEFLLLIPDCEGVEAAGVAATRVIAKVMASGIPHLARPYPAVVTLSAGVASWAPGNPASADEIVSQADTALHAAKKAGRGRVHLWNGPEGDAEGTGSGAGLGEVLLPQSYSLL